MKMGSFKEEKSPGYQSSYKTNIKCVLVGDAMVGKTCLARRLAATGFQLEYSPTMFDNYAATTTIDGKSYVLGIFDTAGQEEFDRLRTLAYLNCDVFLICFSVVQPASLKHAMDSWLREVRVHAPHVPCILVGTQIDLRDDPRPGDRRASGQHVSTKDGLLAASRMGADCYVECSSLTEAGIIRMKEAAIDAVLRTHSSEDGCHCACAIV